MRDGLKGDAVAQRIFAYTVYSFAFSAAVSIVAAQVAAGLVLIEGLWLMATGRRRDNLDIPAAISASVLIILIFLSAAFSGHFDSSIPQLKKSWVLFCIFPLILYSSALSWRRVIQFLIMGAVMASLIGAYRYLSGGVERAAPFSGGYTTLALFEAAALPLAAALFAERKGGRRWLYLAACIIMGAGLVMSQTRAGWLAAIIGILIVGFLADRKWTLIGVALALAAVAVIPQARHMISQRLVSQKQGGFTSGRMILWQAASEPLLHVPVFGYGPGSFSRLVSQEKLERIGDMGIKSWHCTPIDVLLESGPLALLAMLSLVFISLRQAWRSFSHAKDRRLERLSVFAAMLVLYVVGLSTNLMRDFLLMSLLIILWSVSLGIGHETELAGQ